MRITTQMLAHSAAKSGIPFQQTTLLDILNKKSSFSGLLNGVNASADATAIAKKKNYSKLEDISGNLNGYASSLVATDKNSIYDRKAAVQRILFPRQKKWSRATTQR